MGYGEMVATNSTIYLNTHGEMVLRLNGAMVKWRNSEINIDKWRYGETKRFFFHSKTNTHTFPYTILCRFDIIRWNLKHCKL